MCTLIRFEDFAKIGFRVGKVLSVKNSPKARKPSYVLDIDFGAEGVKRSSAQLSANYSIDQVKGRKVVGVVNLPPRQIANIQSDVLIVGFPDSKGNVLLLDVDNSVNPGSKFVEKGHELKQIAYDDFKNACIKAATVVSAKELEGDSGSFHVDLDVGEGRTRKSILCDVGSVNDIIGQQIASVVNLRPSCISEAGYNALVLTVLTSNNRRFPLKIDRKVENGSILF